MKKNRTIVGRKLSMDINPKLQHHLCLYLSLGNTVRTACEAVGISESTFHSYVRRADPSHPDHRPEFTKFSVACAKARSQAKQKLLAVIEQQAPKDWRAAAWLLEKLSPSEFNGNEVQAPGSPLAPPIVHVTIQRDEASDKARKLFGTPPPSRSRCGIIGNVEG